jgi:hypothetical protein
LIAGTFAVVESMVTKLTSQALLLLLLLLVLYFFGCAGRLPQQAIQHLPAHTWQ